MTTFVVSLADGRTAQVEATEATTRASGDLWLLREVAPKPAALAPVAIFARGVWHSCMPDDAPIVWEVAPTSSTPEPARSAGSFA